MQPGSERRAHDAPRIPLDLWIRLSHEDFEEPFNADGVDLSTGGLALRADYLPEIGDRLRCRFDCPPGEGAIEVDGEVVWAHDAGERSGQFGLRFAELAEEAEESLRQLVEHLGGGETRSTARLHLDGVATPIEAEIAARDHEWLTVEQELPFLRLGMGVAVEGAHGPPRGRLASVDLRLSEGVPRLVLGVEYLTDGTEDLGPSTIDEDSEITTRSSAQEAIHRVEDEATLQDFALPDSLRSSISLEDPSDGAGALHTTAASTPREGRRDAVRVFRVKREGQVRRGEAQENAAPATSSEGSSLHPAEEVDPSGTPDRGIARRLTTAWSKARQEAGGLGEKVRPGLVAGWAKLVAFFGVLMEKAGPTGQIAHRKLASGAAWLWAKGSAKVRKRRRRRTTAQPKKTVVHSAPRRRQRAAAEPVPDKRLRRAIVLSALAFAGVGTAVYALTGTDPTEGPASIGSAPTTDPTGEPSGARALPSEPAPAPPAQTSGAPAADATQATEVPALPAPSVTAPEPEGGRLGEPTYPTLPDAVERREVTPPPVTEGTSFGAGRVENGRSAIIRMSQPVTTLRGQRLEDGFTVTIPGSLALDGASPIAATNPDVERATILNRGDHAVLTIRFVSGRNPPYRVAARGSRIEIILGR